jgi:hypothetical protein
MKVKKKQEVETDDRRSEGHGNNEAVGEISESAWPFTNE